MRKRKENDGAIRNLRRAREGRYSLRELGKELGVNYTAINYWETGKRLPSVENGKKLAEFLEEDIEYLMAPDPHYLEGHEEAKKEVS